MTTVTATVTADAAFELHPQVAVRPEPFGALVYHYGNRRLVFLRKPEIVEVVKGLAAHDTVGETLQACGVAPARWPSFLTALSQLAESQVIRAR
jgi:mycofactocin biosynthesis protein MftB